MSKHLWNVTVRAWVVAGKELMPARPINFDGSTRRARYAAPFVALGLAAVAVVGTGTAYAYFSAAGSGDGTATTLNNTTVDFSIGTISTAQLYPGGPAATAPITFKNTAPAALTNVTAVLTPNVTPASQNQICTAADFTTGTTGLPSTLAKGTNSFTLSQLIKMNVVARTGCQNASITVTIKITGQL